MVKRYICRKLRIRENNDIRSIIILANYRFSNKLYKYTNIPIVGKVFLIIIKIFTFIVRIIFKVDLPYECNIGNNIFLAHGGMGVVIHPKVTLGNNVSIYHNVTIGGNALAHFIREDGRKERLVGGAVPVIGSGVLIGAGVSIIGDVVVGDDVKIGANTVIVKSIPNNSTVVPLGSRIIVHDSL